MNINALSKYIIFFLFAVLVVISVLLTIMHAENKALNKANTVLKEQVALRDTAINEIDKKFEKMPTVKDNMQKAIYEIMEEDADKLELVLENGGSALGAALAAAMKPVEG